MNRPSKSNKRFQGQRKGYNPLDRKKVAIPELMKHKKHKASAGKMSEYVQKIYAEADDHHENRLANTTQAVSDEQGVQMSKHQKKISAFHKAQKNFKKKQAERERQARIAEEERKKREEAEAKYKKKKRKKFKKISKANYKGQPNMASRMEMLLEKIQSN